MTFTSVRHFSLFVITSVVILRHIEGFYKLFNTYRRNIYNYLKNIDYFEGDISVELIVL